MSAVRTAAPVIERPDVATALVDMVAAGDAARQQAIARDIVARWRCAPWPAGLVARNCFTSTDGKTVLTYAQWSSDDALARAGGPGEAVAFRLYRVVRGGLVTDPAPVAACFPAAIFPMAGQDAARSWIDGLLDSEEAAEGSNREYPGAIAANFHISLDGTKVLVLSEWASEQEAVAHIEAVIDPLLEKMGSADVGSGDRFRHYVTLIDPAS
jgi:hypothetical protein